MKSIALCTKIHIPVIYHKHPFSELQITDKFYNERQTQKHVKFLAEQKIIPFLQSAKKLSIQHGESFRLALSISGISIQLLEKYYPQALDGIRLLSAEGIVEFMAEPWSNSVLPWFKADELVIQTNLHRRTIEATFGQLPRVFMADLPLNTENYSFFEPYPGCRASFTCSNHLNKKLQNKGIPQGKMAQFLINHTLSQKFQHLASDAYKNTESNPAAPFLRYLRKHVSLVRPLILVFDPLAQNITTYKNWEGLTGMLMKKAKSALYALSDLEEISNYFTIDNNHSEDLLEQHKLTNYWISNNMQKEAFKQFKNIYKTKISTNYPYTPEAWDYLQDLNNFLYMSDSFFLEGFSNQFYNPFRSPHEAFTSYMNAIGSFWMPPKKKPQPVIKMHYFISHATN